MEAAVWLLPGIESVLRGERFVSPGLQNCADVIEDGDSDLEGK
jgi:hypothetical protein